MSRGYEGEVIECNSGKKIVLESASAYCRMSCEECIFSATDCELVPLIGSKCCDITRGCWQKWEAEAP